MKVLAVMCGGCVALGIGAVALSVNMIEHGEITKERMALATAGLLIMGVGVVLSKIAERMEEINEDQGG